MNVKTEVQERPILFKGEMVRAILEGRKTQTRRVVKPQPDKDGGWKGCTSIGDHNIDEFCPYGQLGDRLWVRETWRIVGWWEGEPYWIEYKDGTRKEEPGDSLDYDEDKYAELSMQCDNDCMDAGLKTDEDGAYHIPEEQEVPTRWRPSIFMPRWASRLTLEITGLRVERLQEISDADVAAEGVSVVFHEPGKFGIENPCATGNVELPNGHHVYSTARGCFAALWDSINGKKHPWESNPWVWVISFNKILTID